MDDDQPLEGLHMDNDYEGGEWIGGEFFFKNKKQKRQQTKEEQLYGVFADDGECENESRKGRGRSSGGKADFTKPVAFVCTGDTVQPGKQKDEPISRQSEPAGTHGGIGLGRIGAIGGGLGLKSGYPAHSLEEVERDDSGVLPTAFGQRVKQAAEERKRQAKVESTAKLRQTEAISGKAAGGIGTFEQHTKGIGAKLLAKMGFVPGQGLGKNKQGIAKPVEAKLRPKGMGMGFGERNESEGAPSLPSAKAEEGDEKAGDEPEKSKQKDSGMWKRRNAQARVRREYKTAEEILEQQADAVMVVQQPILDMRGPQARLVTNMESLDVKTHEDGGDAVPMPELQHNLRLIVDLAESEIGTIDAKLRQEKDTAVLLGRQQTRQELELEQAEDELQHISGIMYEMERASSTADLAGLLDIYGGLRKNHPEQFIMYNIPAAALFQILPLMKQQLAGLRPLEDPKRGAEEMKLWRPVLETDQVKDAIFAAAAAEDDPYCCLLTEVVLPHVRSVITNLWQPRDPEPLLRWLEAWDPALTSPIRDHLLTHQVLPALTKAVEAWEPRQETVPIHSWLHPWLPWLGPQLKPLYQPLRFKLARALEEWHPSDGSALALLAPWQRVFDDADWEALLSRSIVPKLAFALDHLHINPAAQDMTPFTWFTSWSGYMPERLCAQLLEAHFFPKFLQVLDHWLATSQNYDEVTRWYLGWKSAIPPLVADHERVRKGLNTALDLMNRRMAGDTTPFVYTPNGFGARRQPDISQPSLPQNTGRRDAPMGLRELVQAFAEENGITFMPKPGRFWEGHQVYGFGGISVVIEVATSVLRAHVNDRWTPMSMESLLLEAKRR